MYLPEEPSVSSTCPAPPREAAKLQELFVKLDKALNMLHVCGRKTAVKFWSGTNPVVESQPSCGDLCCQTWAVRRLRFDRHLDC
jgi:hypothetical protein